MFGCFQQGSAKNQNIRQYDNITTVDSYHPTGSYIAPYPRPNIIGAYPSCGDIPTCGPDNVNPPCGPYNTASFYDSDVSHSVTITHAGYSNYFTQSNRYDNNNHCRRVGFKNVAAQVIWQGRFGFNGAGLTQMVPNGNQYDGYGNFAIVLIGNHTYRWTVGSGNDNKVMIIM